MLESSQSKERCEAVSVLEEKVAIRETVHLHAGFQLLSLLTRHLVVVVFMTLYVDSSRGVRLHGCWHFPSFPQSASMDSGPSRLRPRSTRFITLSCS
jgi:hypothetical protein